MNKGLFTFKVHESGSKEITIVTALNARNAIKKWWKMKYIACKPIITDVEKLGFLNYDTWQAQVEYELAHIHVKTLVYATKKSDTKRS